MQSNKSGQWEDREKGGTLFSEQVVECVGSGSCLIDGKSRSFVVLKRFDRKGAPFFELFQSCGRLFYNSPETKKNPDSADLRGKVFLSGERESPDRLTFSGWSKTASNGNSFISFKLEEPFQKEG